jgi:hypothetical protein
MAKSVNDSLHSSLFYGGEISLKGQAFTPRTIVGIDHTARAAKA